MGYTRIALSRVERERAQYDYGSERVSPLVLIDNPYDEIIELQAWVEVNMECVTPERAREMIEHSFPIEDRPDGEDYHASGSQVWMKPQSWFALDRSRWIECDPGDAGARKFWTVRVTCPI